MGSEISGISSSTLSSTSANSPSLYRSMQALFRPASINLNGGGGKLSPLVRISPPFGDTASSFSPLFSRSLWNVNSGILRFASSILMITSLPSDKVDTSLHGSIMNPTHGSHLTAYLEESREGAPQEFFVHLEAMSPEQKIKLVVPAARFP